MRTARCTLALLTAAAVSLPAMAAAAPPMHSDTFPVTADLEQAVGDRVAALCNVAVASVDGTGTIRFTQFVDEQGEVVRGQGHFHLTFDVTTTDGRRVTLRERSTDRYDFVDGNIVLTTTSGRAVAFLDSIGRLVTDPDGETTSTGRASDVCGALR